MTRFTPHGPRGELAPGDEGKIGFRSSGWGVLAAEVFDNDEGIVVRLEAPGMEPDEFSLHAPELDAQGQVGSIGYE